MPDEASFRHSRLLAGEPAEHPQRSPHTRPKRIVVRLPVAMVCAGGEPEAVLAPGRICAEGREGVIDADPPGLRRILELATSGDAGLPGHRGR